MEVEIPTEQRINMSLDELIKQKQQLPQTTPRRSARNNRPRSGGQSGGKTAVKPNPANNVNARPRRNRRPRSGNNNSSNSNNAMEVDETRVAKSVGQSRAKRNAVINARRGLSQTAQATKQEIRNEVNKELAKKSGGLKISFKPGELNKTTERQVSQQIRAVLSRQLSPRSGGRNTTANNNNNNNNNRNGGNNNVDNTNNNNNQRNGPRARPKSGTLRVYR
jgi:hypothetical protein